MADKNLDLTVDDFTIPDKKLELKDTYIFSLCEVRDLENNLITVGYITSIEPDCIEIKYKYEKMQLIRAFSEVKIVVSKLGMDSATILGRVYIATYSLLKIGYFTDIFYEDHREDFRVNIFKKALIVPADSYYTFERQVSIIADMGVIIIDISVGGLLFEANFTFDLGDVVRIKLVLMDTEFFLNCEILRKLIAKNGYLRYGCRFKKLKNSEFNMLYKIIMNVQNQIIISKKGESNKKDIK